MYSIKMKSWFTLILLTCFAWGNVNAASYFVSTTGDDANAGNLVNPFKTVGKALSVSVAGDNITIAAGTYSEISSVTINLTINTIGSVSLNSLRMVGSGINLTLSGTAGVLNIRDSLSLLNGKITVDKPNVQLHLLANATVNYGHVNSFVQPGFYMHHNANTSKSFTWAIGSGTNYRPVVLEGFNQSVVADHWYYAEFVPTAPTFTVALPGDTRNISLLHHWFLNSSASSAATNAYELTFYYDSVSTDDHVYDAPKLQLLRSNGVAAWDERKEGGTKARKGSITTSPTNNLDYFVLGNKKGALVYLGGANSLGSLDPFVSFSFDFLNRCTGDTIKFTNLTTNRKNAAFLWTFGDEALTGTSKGKTFNAATDENLAHIYNRAGTYTVSLRVTNATNNPDLGNFQFTVGVSPRLVGFNPVEIYRYPHNGADTFDDPTVCEGERFWMIDNYDISNPITNPNGDLVNNLTWRIQGLTPEPTQSITNPVPSSDTFKQIVFTPGSYKVVAQRTTNKGCVASDVRDLVIYGKPQPLIDAVDKCETPPNTTILVTNNTPNPYPSSTNKVIKWTWDYEGLRVVDEKVNKSYLFQNAHAGPNFFKIIVETEVGCIDSQPIKTVSIFPKPIAIPNLSNFCIGETTEANATPSIVSFGGNIDQYLWNFNFGVAPIILDSNRITNYTYTETKTYKIQLRVRTTDLCFDDTVVNIRIHPKPTPTFQIGEVCNGDSTSLRRVIDRYPNRDSMLYFWYLDNKFIGTDTNFKYYLPNAGNYNLRLSGSSLAGCTDSIIKPIRSYYNPKPSFVLDPSVNPNDTIQCFNWNKFTFNYNYGVDIYDTMKESRWSWGDSTFEIPAVSTSHSYLRPDTFDVTFWVNNIHDCNDSVTTTFIVHPSPVADFDYSGVCVPDSIAFIDSTSTSDYPIVDRIWEFGNGDRDTASLSPKSFYLNSGPWDVTYTIYSSLGCSDTVVRTLDSLVDKPIVNWQIVAGSMPLCKGDTAIFKVGGGDSVSWQHDLDTSTVRGFWVTGNYKFTVFNKGICPAQDSVQVFAYPPASIVAHNDTIIYRGRIAKMYVSNAYLNVKWSPGYLLEDSTLIMVKTKRLVDSVRFYVSALDSNGCPDMDSVTIRIIDPPLVKIPNIITPNGDEENETWNLIDIPDVFMLDIVITDRQGKRVFTSTNYHNDWSALDDKGNPLPNGVYFYYIKNRDTSVTYKGFIQVIR